MAKLVPKASQSNRLLTLDLQRPAEAIKGKFRLLKAGRDVADLLEIEPSQLDFVTSRAKHFYSYHSFDIPKKSGRPRTILAPHPTVKILQRKLLQALNELYPKAHPAAHGFVRRRSILTNAQAHQDKRLVLNVDLEDFFSSITFPRVRGLFIKRFRLPGPAATVLARICCNTDDNPDHLPQGAPTSPIISNMICHAMDQALTKLAGDHGVYYSRYADDLTFSTNRHTFPEALAEKQAGHPVRLGDALVTIVQADNGFTLNPRKSRLLSKARRQEVTGLTVNRRANVSRTSVRQLRGILHAWHAHEYENAEAEYRRRFDLKNTGASLRLVVQGKLAFLRQIRGVDDRVFRRLYGWARDLDEKTFPELPDMTAARSLQIAAAEFPAISKNDSVELRKKYLLRMFASAQGTLWVVDPNLHISAIRELTESFEPGRVQEIRLLSQSPEKNKVAREGKAYAKLVAKLAKSGLSLEWRTSQQELFHDRWIVDEKTCVHMGGPINYILRPDPPYSQNSVTPRPEQLDHWWQQSSPLPANPNLA